ncbi:DUF6625 family protein [Bacteroides acidifaciens]|uniref:DUF6625 family protein n=1 Tax=Bacteroides acidifaciens TaxID=85831 RepID=UPI00339DA139
MLNFYTCGRQKNVYFIYYTDCEAIIDMALDYPNIICYKCSFEDYCEMVSDKLKVKFKPMHSYKLCDLKPFLWIYSQRYFRRIRLLGLR